MVIAGSVDKLKLISVGMMLPVYSIIRSPSCIVRFTNRPRLETSGLVVVPWRSATCPSYWQRFSADSTVSSTERFSGSSSSWLARRYQSSPGGVVSLRLTSPCSFQYRCRYIALRNTSRQKSDSDGRADMMYPLRPKHRTPIVNGYSVHMSTEIPIIRKVLRRRSWFSGMPR